MVRGLWPQLLVVLWILSVSWFDDPQTQRDWFGAAAPFFGSAFAARFSGVTSPPRCGCGCGCGCRYTRPVPFPRLLPPPHVVVVVVDIPGLNRSHNYCPPTVPPAVRLMLLLRFCTTTGIFGIMYFCRLLLLLQLLQHGCDWQRPRIMITILRCW